MARREVAHRKPGEASQQPLDTALDPDTGEGLGRIGRHYVLNRACWEIYIQPAARHRKDGPPDG